MDKNKMEGKRTTRAESKSKASSPTSATAFSATASRRHPTLPSLRADVDYSKYNLKKMKKLRLVTETEWFPPQRHDRRLTSSRFWTVVQKDLYLALKSQASDMRWIDWPSVNQSVGADVDVCGYFAATPGLDKLLERQDLSWADSHIRQFYATLWIHPDRSRIKFMFGNQQRELSRDDFAGCLGLSCGGARVHTLAYPNGNSDEVHLPPVEDIRHLYINPDAVMEFWKDQNQLNHETAVVNTVVRMSIRPRVGGRESLTTVEIWLLHLLRSAQPVDIVDLMIGEMQDTILTIRRRLPYAPYLIRLFDKKGWLEDGMKRAFDQHLKPYKAPRPDDKRRIKNRENQHDKSYKALKPDDNRRLGTRSLPAQMEAGFDDDEHVELDQTLIPSIQEQALGDTTNGEADTDPGHIAPPPVAEDEMFLRWGEL
ncbi:uncharacterized protein LOC119309164 [Triticum dicoccoides]|uniref:uncharacterized protein LOC119309164 n=1 Tax=Triticum dicoccoides TaxID=85692 RepID=UPI00189184F0|nr:uncharacterized protein LOC119309164 [Triticum dicoccoides]